MFVGSAKEERFFVEMKNGRGKEANSFAGGMGKKREVGWFFCANP